MAVLLVVLALFPCQDLPAATPGEAVDSEVQTDKDMPSHHDDCTPLCSCTCCGTLVAALLCVAQPVSADPHPPVGQTRPEHIPTWKPLLAATRLAQPPRS